MTNTRATRAQIRELADRLAPLAAGLSPSDRALLETIIEAAIAAAPVVGAPGGALLSLGVPAPRPADTASAAGAGGPASASLLSGFENAYRPGKAVAFSREAVMPPAPAGSQGTVLKVRLV